MATTLYWGSGSGPSWRVMLALLVKGIDYTSRRLNPGQKEHKAEAYLALNPRGQFPTLVHDEIVVRDSYAILQYLDAAFPEPSLFGASPAAVARIATLSADLQEHVLPALGSVIRPIFRNKVEGNEAAIQEAFAKARRELGALSTSLAEQPWLGGEAICAADLLLFPEIKRLQRAATREAAAALDFSIEGALAELQPLTQWRERIEALDGYEDTYPPHWR